MITFLFINNIHAEDTVETRIKAAKRYQKITHLKNLMNSFILEMAKQTPKAKRKEFISSMNKIINVNELE